VTNLRHFLAGAVFSVAAIALAAPQVANAKPGPVDPQKVQALAAQIEAALGGAGCGASVDADVATIESTIAGSGADPAVAMAALQLAQTDSDLCANAKPAVASVDQTIAEASIGGGAPTAGGPGPAGGPGGGAPIGSPSAFVGGGGSDYLVR
jgi:hypothetical protein